MARKQPELDVEITGRTDPRVVDELDDVLEVLAEAFADLLIDRARADVARELGIDADRLATHRGRAAAPARLMESLPMFATHREKR